MPGGKFFCLFLGVRRQFSIQFFSISSVWEMSKFLYLFCLGNVKVLFIFCLGNIKVFYLFCLGYVKVFYFFYLEMSKFFNSSVRKMSKFFYIFCLGNVKVLLYFIKINILFIYFIKGQLLAVISTLFNESVETAHFSLSLKIARIVPAYKEGVKTSVKNCRPISVLPFIGKMFEQLMYARLNRFFKANDICRCRVSYNAILVGFKGAFYITLG